MAGDRRDHVRDMPCLPDSPATGARCRLAVAGQVEEDQSRGDRHEHVQPEQLTQSAVAPAVKHDDDGSIVRIAGHIPQLDLPAAGGDQMCAVTAGAGFQRIGGKVLRHGHSDGPSRWTDEHARDHRSADQDDQQQRHSEQDEQPPGHADSVAHPKGGKGQAFNRKLDSAYGKAVDPTRRRP
jgi:hypothetical protein